MFVSCALMGVILSFVTAGELSFVVSVTLQLVLLLLSYGPFPLTDKKLFLNV